MSLKDAVAYWKLRLLVDALEKVAIPEETKPGVSASTKKGLKKLLADTTARQISENDKLPTVLVEDSELNDELLIGNQELHQCLADKKSLLLLHNWINVELKKVAEEVVAAYKWRLERSADPSDKELLRRLMTHSNPLDIISDKIAQEMEEEANLNAEIEKWSRFRDAEMEACRTSALEMNNLLKDYNNELNGGRYATVISQYTDFVELESEVLNNKQMLGNMKQKIAENPPELMDQLESSYNRLLDTQSRIRSVIQELSEKKAKYQALGPEFGALLAEWNEYGQLIQQKEFVLNGIDAVASNEQSFNASLNSSLAFESP